MVKKETKKNNSYIKGSKGKCCKVEAITNIDERGQMVLPKSIRDKAKIGAGDKLAIMTYEKDGKVCCISLIKAEDLTGMVKDLLGPMMEEIILK